MRKILTRNKYIKVEWKLHSTQYFTLIGNYIVIAISQLFFWLLASMTSVVEWYVPGKEKHSTTKVTLASSQENNREMAMTI